jgi:hypothetical protein
VNVDKEVFLKALNSMKITFHKNKDVNYTGKTISVSRETYEKFVELMELAKRYPDYSKNTKEALARLKNM